MMKIRYQHWEAAWLGFDAYLEDLILRTGAQRLCELGGGANPALFPAFIKKHGLDYTVLDISATELAKADAGYHTIIADIAAEDFAPPPPPQVRPGVQQDAG